LLAWILLCYRVNVTTMMDVKLVVACLTLVIVISQSLAKTITDVNKALVDEDPCIEEGDIRNCNSNKKRRKRRSAYGFSWPHNSRDGLIYVPYVYSHDYPVAYQMKVEQVVQQYAEMTCIRLIPRTNEASYINVIAGGGCWSYIGRQPIQPQEVSLPDGCLSNGTIAHEFMHALGFSHEHSRWDRDQHIKILWENVEERYKPQFDHPPRGDALVYGAKYDYNSVMHYGNYAFQASSATGKTIERIDDVDFVFGQRDGFSVIDLVQINRRYMCHKHQKNVRPIDKNEELKFKVTHEKEADQSTFGFGPWGKKK